MLGSVFFSSWSSPANALNISFLQLPQAGAVLMASSELRAVKQLTKHLNPDLF